MSEISEVSYAPKPQNTVYFILTSVAVCHMLNDMMSSSLLPSLYPMFKTMLNLTFTQIGLLSLTYQLTASLLQPLVGLYTDHHPLPFSLPIGLCSTFVGLLLLSTASSFHAVVFAAALAGIGSSVFHPESSRVARMASGGKYGFAQSLFQVGGKRGSGGRSAADRLCGSGEGPVEHRLVLAHRPADDHPARSGELLVQRSPDSEDRGRACPYSQGTRFGKEGTHVHRNPGGPHLLEALLPG